jgi:hypothetical protein
MNEAYQIFLHTYNTNSHMNSNYGTQKFKINFLHNPQQNRITFTFHTHTQNSKKQTKLLIRNWKR